MKISNGVNALVCGLVEIWKDGLFIEALHSGESTLVSFWGTSTVQTALYSIAISAKEVRWRRTDEDHKT